MCLRAPSVVAQDVRLLGREAQPRPKEGRSYFVRVQAIRSAKSCSRVALWGMGRSSRLALRRFCPGFLDSSLKLAADRKVHTRTPLTRFLPSSNIDAWSKRPQSWRSRQPSQEQGAVCVRSSGFYVAHPSFSGVRLVPVHSGSAILAPHPPRALLPGTRSATLIDTRAE